VKIVAVVRGNPIASLAGSDGYVDICTNGNAVVWLHGAVDDMLRLVPTAEQAWLVDEHPQWDGAAPTAPVVPGHKQISFLRRAPIMSHDQFADHWTERHTPLARKHHPALWRYRQNVVREALLPGTPEVDGIAELTMRLRLDFLDRMYDSEEGKRIVGEDIKRFLDLRSSWRLLGREYRLRSVDENAL
jgi:uncharacterized protein (TIGR02118 family)